MQSSSLTVGSFAGVTITTVNATLHLACGRHAKFLLAVGTPSQFVTEGLLFVGAETCLVSATFQNTWVRLVVRLYRPPQVATTPSLYLKVDPLRVGDQITRIWE